MNNNAFIHLFRRNNKMHVEINGFTNIEVIGILFQQLMKTTMKYIYNQERTELENDIESTGFNGENISKILNNDEIPKCDFDNKECAFKKTFKKCKGKTCPQYPEKK